MIDNTGGAQPMRLLIEAVPNMDGTVNIKITASANMDEGGKAQLLHAALGITQGRMIQSVRDMTNAASQRRILTVDDVAAILARNAGQG